MIGTVLFVSLAALAYGQRYNDPRNAAIIQEQRYLSADGKFGSSYSQEDGVQFKEEADPDGTRRGSYSYVDPSGTRRTVSYTAGKFGFQASGDHLPSGPAPTYPQQPPYQPQPQYQPPQPSYNPAPVYNNNPVYNSPPQPQPAYNPPAPVYREPTTTPAPHRFYPPGKLSLNRSPDGFSYTFNKS